MLATACAAGTAHATHAPQRHAATVLPQPVLSRCIDGASHTWRAWRPCGPHRPGVRPYAAGAGPARAWTSRLQCTRAAACKPPHRPPASSTCLARGRLRGARKTQAAGAAFFVASQVKIKRKTSYLLYHVECARGTNLIGGRVLAARGRTAHSTVSPAGLDADTRRQEAELVGPVGVGQVAGVVDLAADVDGHAVAELQALVAELDAVGADDDLVLASPAERDVPGPCTPPPAYPLAACQSACPHAGPPPTGRPPSHRWLLSARICEIAK